MSFSNLFAVEVVQGVAKTSSEMVPKWMHHWMGVDLTPESSLQVNQWSEAMLLECYWRAHPVSDASDVYDPQHYLFAVERSVVDDLLKKHSEVSRLPIDVIIFGKGQALPNDMAPKWVWKRFYDGKPKVVIFYFLGDPSSAVAYIHGGKKSHEVDAFRTKELVNKAANFAARQGSNSKEQCYGFIAEVSRRMYWIEDELGLVQIDHKATVDFNEEVEEEEESSLDQWLDKLGVTKALGKHRGLISLIVMSLVALLIALLGVFVYRRFCSYEFPLYGGPRRLGGRHGAGLGEIVSFKDANVSLVDQKKKLKNEEL